MVERKARKEAKRKVKEWLNKELSFKGIEGSRAIHIACAMGKNEVLTSLYKHGADIKA